MRCRGSGRTSMTSNSRREVEAHGTRSKGVSLLREGDRAGGSVSGQPSSARISWRSCRCRTEKRGPDLSRAFQTSFRSASASLRRRATSFVRDSTMRSRKIAAGGVVCSGMENSSFTPCFAVNPRELSCRSMRSNRASFLTCGNRKRYCDRRGKDWPRGAGGQRCCYRRI